MKNYKKDLEGHSGCKVVLINNGTNVFVRKTSGSISYNNRLTKQFIKQKKFFLKGIKTPDILQYGKDKNNLFYFDMEFVSGKTFAEYLPQLSTEEIKNYIKYIFDNIYLQPTEQNLSVQKIFTDKIIDLETKLTNYKNLKGAFLMLKKYDWTKICKSFCHGDLTLENIIITYNKQLYLIDFLDSFYNSWMIDIAKILHDIDLEWSYRNSNLTTNLALRLEIAKMALLDEILRLKNGQDIILSIYYVLLLNILRIYPYTTDNPTIIYLNNTVEKLQISIENIKKGRIV